MCVKKNEKDLPNIFTAAVFFLNVAYAPTPFGFGDQDARSIDPLALKIRIFPQTFVRLATETSGPVCQSPRYVCSGEKRSSGPAYAES